MRERVDHIGLSPIKPPMARRISAPVLINSIRQTPASGFLHSTTRWQLDEPRGHSGAPGRALQGCVFSATGYTRRDRIHYATAAGDDVARHMCNASGIKRELGPGLRSAGSRQCSAASFSWFAARIVHDGPCGIPMPRPRPTDPPPGSFPKACLECEGGASHPVEDVDPRCDSLPLRRARKTSAWHLPSCAGLARRRSWAPIRV